MADTTRGDLPGETCTDCGNKEVAFKHWGPLVPAGKSGKFCGDCFKSRANYYNENGEPKPLPETTTSN